MHLGNAIAFALVVGRSPQHLTPEEILGWRKRLLETTNPHAWRQSGLARAIKLEVQKYLDTYFTNES